MSEIKLQVGVKVFLKNKEGKFLFQKRNKEKYPNAKGSWDIIGGRIDPGTRLLENLIREIKEETQLELTSEPRLICAQDIMPDAERHIIRLSYLGETDGEPVLDTNENTEYKWLTLDEIRNQENLDIYVEEIIKADLIK